MKNLLITTAAVLFILTMMGSWFQLGDVIGTRGQLKGAADEAASTAALCIEADAFGEGILTFDEEKARREAGKMIDILLEDKKEDVSWEIGFSEAQAGKPWVSVTIYYEKLKAVSVYEYVPLQQRKEGL